MKASGITKCSNKKWSVNFTGEQSMAGMSASRSSRPVIQVDEEIHFLVDSNGLNNFSALVPNEKSIELSRRTYSKKNPIACPLPDMSTYAIHLPVKSKSQTSPAKCNLSENKSTQRKRKTRLELLNPTPPKIQKKTFQPEFKSLPQSSPAKVPRESRSKSSPSTPSNCDSDSDVEIVAVKLFKPVTVQVNKSSNNSIKKLSNAQASQSNKRKSKFFSPQVNHNEVVMNEADIAPTMSTDIFPDGRTASNSMRWLSANGTISVPGLESCSFTENVVAPPKSGCHLPIHLPEIKTTHEKVPGKKNKSRELDSLYKNLNEISWTHETSFKNLLRNPDYIRHSERSIGRILGTGKNLRKLKEKKASGPSKKITAANVLARKKSKMARLNQNRKAKASGKNRMHPAMKASGSKNVKKTALTNGIKKNGLKEKAASAEKGFEEERDVFYMLNPDALKPKQALLKGKPSLLKAKPSKTKPDKLKGKFDSAPKIKTESFKTKSSILKLKPDGPRTKSDVYKVSPDAPKGKPDVKKFKSYVSIKKPLDSPPSTSGLQKIGCSSRSAPSSSHSRPYGKTSDMKNMLKDYDNGFHFPNDMQMLRGYLDKNDDMYSAFQNASKLRVRLQPLEHTDLWTTEFYEDFRKHFLDQALRKALENRDNDSSNIMYQELLDSFMSSQNAGSSSTNRVVKRKRPEEEALRSSVRQSEGAFRYKEIVVKRHPEYMQVVLVPNEGKQNSLTVEAMKELKEAFLLAKKDPNCRAVLLNSSGPYFCTGIDLAPLVGSNKRQAAEDISNSIRDLVMTLGMFTKPVIAAVNGAALGFGVSLLTYCDVVLASDKATFCLPAMKIGYIPEGGITYTLPQVVGCSVASEMFMQGRRITAEQACRYGLVSEVIWPTRLMNEVIPRLQTIISQPLQAMEATKTMVRCHLWDKLKGHVDRERRLLCEHWLGAPCQSNIKTLLQTGWLLD